MLLAQNMMEDCDFSGVSDVPTIFNFTTALGKAVGIIDMDAVNKFIDRKFWTYNFVVLGRYPDRKSVNIEWGVTE